mmetsp:Transcript_25324/g.55519  ORF Transcript_25324/g.55519 Transcript_25324/m.55519 type:complete len:121 (+) Transcript_25324:1-363(+)
MVALSGIFCYSYLKQTQAETPVQPPEHAQLDDANDDSQGVADGDKLSFDEDGPLSPPIRPKISRGNSIVRLAVEVVGQAQKSYTDLTESVQAATYGRPEAEDSAEDQPLTQSREGSPFDG